ncbi:hypothetical protein R6Q59_029364 [Mikania micrantha]
MARVDLLRQVCTDAISQCLKKLLDQHNGPNVFGLLKQTRKGAQINFRGLRLLEKFGRFGEVENVYQGNRINVIIAEEHDVQVQVERQEDEQVNPEIEINPVEDVVLEMIDQDFDSTLDEAGTSENLTPRKRSRRDPHPEPHSVKVSTTGTSTSRQRLDTEDMTNIFQEKESESYKVMRDVGKGKEVNEAPVNVHALQERVFVLEKQLDDQYVVTTEKSYYDQVGDRSGIHSWHYDGDKRMWVVKRKSGNLEYYESPFNFESWTRVDLAKLDELHFLIGQMIQEEQNFMIFFMKKFD